MFQRARRFKYLFNSLNPQHLVHQSGTITVNPCFKIYAMAEDYYILPSSPTVFCEDRFSITGSDELLVPFWEVLATLLSTSKVDSPAALIDILETIAVVRRGRSDTDYGYLKEFLSALDRRQHFLINYGPRSKILRWRCRLYSQAPGFLFWVRNKQVWSSRDGRWRAWLSTSSCALLRLQHGMMAFKTFTSGTLPSSLMRRPWRRI